MTAKKNYSIVFLEFDGHWDGVDGFCRITGKTDLHVTILCDTYIYNSIRSYDYGNNIAFLVKDANQRRKAFIISHQPMFNHADVVFINTVHEELADFASITTNGIIILRVHNAYKQLSPMHHLRIGKSPFLWRKSFSYIFREIFMHRYLHYAKIVNARADYFTFLSESITNYVRKKKLIDDKKIMFSIPLLPYANLGEQKSREEIIISVIGALDPRKKDYVIISKALKKLFDNSYPIKKKVSVYFLGNGGNAYGRRIISEIQSINNKNFSFNYYFKNVPVEEFDSILQKTHIIISPLRIKNQIGIFEEIYGQTKFSGSVGSLIKFPAIGIFPEKFIFDDDFSNFFYKYKDEDHLCAMLKQLISNPEEIYSQIEKFKEFLSAVYNKNRILENLLEFIKEKVKH